MNGVAGVVSYISNNSGGALTITIRNFSNTTVVNAASMSEVGTSGVFFYNWTPSASGHYYATINVGQTELTKTVLIVQDQVALNSTLDNVNLRVNNLPQG